MADLTVGCCGWPEGRARYFEHFAAVELQDTFYQPPSAELAAKWRREAPAGFEFSMKAWQLITHAASSPTYRRLKTPVPEGKRDAYGRFRATEEVRAAWQHTLAVARALRAPVIVFQCPASLEPNEENIANLRSFFRRIEREDRLAAWEPRGRWPADLIGRICADLDLVHCVDPFQAEPLYGRALYFRLHGRGGYRYRYSDEELRQLGEVVRRHQAAQRRPAWVMFNNVYMKDDALRFQALISGP